MLTLWKDFVFSLFCANLKIKTMKIKDLLQNIDKTKESEDLVYIDDFAEKVLDLYGIYNWDEQRRLISYYFGSWHCTDQEVGYKVYFFDDVPVAISSQYGRKMNEDFEWVSKEAFKKVKDYVLSFKEVEEDTPDLLDLEEDLGDSYKIEFYKQLYESHKNNAIYNNQSVTIVDYKKSFNDGVYHPEKVEIQYQDGVKEWVETDLLLFPFNLKK